jgi:ABC-2 type transport system permease protein
MFRARARMLLQYRAAALAGIGTQLVFGIVRVMIYDGFYQSTDLPQPLSARQTTSYIWLGQAMLLLTMWGVDNDIAGQIRAGTIGYELVRPASLYGLWLARGVSNRLAPLLLRAGPILLISGLFLGLQPPASLAAAALFVVALASAVLLAAAMSVLLTITMLWTISGEGIARLAPAAIFFLSGMIIPVPLFPAWMQPALAILPFRGLIDTPFRIYLGSLAGVDVCWALGHQVLWAVAFVVAGRALLGQGLKRLVMQGG